MKFVQFGYANDSCSVKLYYTYFLFERKHYW